MSERCGHDHHEAGLPARDVYGVRVDKSQLGYKSLGVATENVTKAQHCRAEVYIGGHGWIPVDPADVRKVVLEEKVGGTLPLDDGSLLDNDSELPRGGASEDGASTSPPGRVQSNT